MKKTDWRDPTIDPMYTTKINTPRKTGHWWIWILIAAAVLFAIGSMT